MNVVFCHGIGSHKATYARATIRALREGLGDRAQDIHWSSVLWSGVLDQRQDRLMRAVSAGGDLDWTGPRREYVISGLGDACAYLGDRQTQHKILDRVGDAFARLPDGPTVVLCHSMGCAVMMDYLESHAPSRTPVQCAVLFGCNLPLFWLAHPEGQPLPLPPIDRVYNLYDSDDLLAYPLKEVSDQTRAWVTGDYRLSTGTILGAHSGYWTDSDFVNWVTKCLKRELKIAASR